MYNSTMVPPSTNSEHRYEAVSCVVCRSAILCWRTVSSGVLDPATEAVATLHRSRAGRVWQVDVVRGARLSTLAIQQVRQQRGSLIGGGRRRRLGNSRRTEQPESAR